MRIVCDGRAAAAVLGPRSNFANAYVELHPTKQDRRRLMDSETVAGSRFPKHYGEPHLTT